MLGPGGQQLRASVHGTPCARPYRASITHLWPSGSLGAVAKAARTASEAPAAAEPGPASSSTAAAAATDAHCAPSYKTTQDSNQLQFSSSANASSDTASVNAPAALPTKTLRPYAARRCRSTHVLCEMLYHNRSSVDPDFWIAALVHLSHLVDKEGQQVPLVSWKRLKECLMYLVTEQQQEQHIFPQQVGQEAQQGLEQQQQEMQHQQQQELPQQYGAQQEQHQLLHPALVKHPQQQRQQGRQSEADVRLQQQLSNASVDDLHPQQQHQHQHQQQQFLQYHQGSSTLQQQQQPPSQAAAAAAPGSPPPITRFTASETAALLWTLAKLNIQLPASSQKRFWPVVLQHISSSAVSGYLAPKDTALLAWSLLQLQAPMPSGWFQGLLDAQAGVLPVYHTGSLVILLHAAARLKARLPLNCVNPLLGAVQPRLRRMACRDMAQLVWSLAVLKVRPSAEFMSEVMTASKRTLSGASCSELTALLVGVARMSYVPSGPWLLELYDQLYWTADQLELRQITSVIWALGRMRSVAVPQELLERLLAFAQMQLLPLLEAQPGGSSSSSSKASASVAILETASNCSAAQQWMVSKEIYRLLQGLVGLRNQLPAGLLMQSNIGQTWIKAVAAAEGPLMHIHIPACLHAAALLGLRLSGCQDRGLTLSGPRQAVRTSDAGCQDSSGPGQAVRSLPGPQRGQAVRAIEGSGCQDPSGPCQAVLMRLSALRPSLSHTSLALGFWGAVGVGCRPDREWVDSWLTESQHLLGVATAAEINMILQTCIRLQHVPSVSWLTAVYSRLEQLLLLEQRHGSGGSSSDGWSGSSMVSMLKYLAALQEQWPKPQSHTEQRTQQQGAMNQQQQQRHQQQQWVPVPVQLLARMSVRMEYLERHRAASPTSLRQFQQLKLKLFGQDHVTAAPNDVDTLL